MSCRTCLWAFAVVCASSLAAVAQTSSPVVATSPKPFDGLEMNLGNLHRLSDAETRSISAENFTGEKGRGGMAVEGFGQQAARELGQGWKVSPAIVVPAGTTFTLADIHGAGAIQQIWMTPTRLPDLRYFIVRFYWDDETEPSVESPVGDLFACGWGKYCPINSLPVCVNPGSAFNCYWTMPFRKAAKITFENRSDKEMRLYYQINYTLTDVPADAAYFHAQFRRVNRLPAKTDYTILDGVRGRGQYVGTYMAWETQQKGWWGEGEIKFFMDGDRQFPTICGTGTEDYFCGSYGFVNLETKRYQTFSTPYAGFVQTLPTDQRGVIGQRFGLYRWHITDPIRFKQDLRVTMQSLGWKSEHRYLHLEDDIASVAYWYQTEPHAKFPALPSKESLAVTPQTLGASEKK
ncbi:MAG: glycoside hydrolase family 172 protein [Thermoguttaceae bacterium]